MRRTAIAIAIIMLLAAGSLIVLTIAFPFGVVVAEQNPGLFDRPVMEAIVSQVRTAGLAPGEEHALELASLSDPKSLGPPQKGFSTPNQPRGIRVWASVSTSGQLKVTIETRPGGHAGSYGFAYSDIPLSPKKDGTLDVPGYLSFVEPDKKIDDHWWAVFNNLD